MALCHLVCGAVLQETQKPNPMGSMPERHYTNVTSSVPIETCVRGHEEVWEQIGCTLTWPQGALLPAAPLT